MPVIRNMSFKKMLGGRFRRKTLEEFQRVRKVVELEEMFATLLRMLSGSLEIIEKTDNCFRWRIADAGRDPDRK